MGALLADREAGIQDDRLGSRLVTKQDQEGAHCNQREEPVERCIHATEDVGEDKSEGVRRLIRSK